MTEYRISGSFQSLWRNLEKDILRKQPVTRGSWQSLDVSDSRHHDVFELLNVTAVYSVPHLTVLRKEVQPQLPWADEHFVERVSGIPYNPPPSHEKWSGHKGNNGIHLDESGRFSHTYPERFWPVYDQADDVRRGIRYSYGDMDDVLVLLKNNLLTRQAYLPIWFPEDTGALDRRVPCTLGYHFQYDPVREMLNVTYMIRSCDFVRHFRNDVYLASRLLLWVGDNLGVNAGDLVMHIMNLHLMRGDRK
ncbi:MAG: thymidylate synthase [Pseudonocardiaceae bacterium]